MFRYLIHLSPRVKQGQKKRREEKGEPMKNGKTERK
jgi:hypothetical protein